MKIIPILLLSLLSLSACVGTVVGTAADVAIEVVKVPFKVGGAIIDGVSGDDEEDKAREEEQAREEREEASQAGQ